MDESLLSAAIFEVTADPAPEIGALPCVIECPFLQISAVAPGSRLQNDGGAFRRTCDESLFFSIRRRRGTPAVLKL